MFTKSRLWYLFWVSIILIALASLEGGISHGSGVAAPSLTSRLSLDSTDLALTFIPDLISPPPDATAAFHLTAVNNGPDTASQVTLMSQINSGGLVTGVDPADWNCITETFTVTCQRPDLPYGPAQEVVVYIRVPALFNTIGVRFSVSSETLDPNEINNVLNLFIGIAD